MNAGSTMIRKTVYLIPEQAERVRRRAKDLGVSQSEVIRRAIEAYLSTRLGEKKHGEYLKRPTRDSRPPPR